MPIKTVHVSSETYAALKVLAAMKGEPMTVVLDRAVEAYRRVCFLDACDLAYARLRSNPDTWAQEIAERAEWEATLSDGLQDA
jgi:predicted transcriptional regulator